MRSDDRINMRKSQSLQKSQSPERHQIQKERSRQKYNKVEYYMGPDLHLTKHYYFLSKSQNSISYPIAVWNLCMIMGKRPALCLIICESESQIYKILQFNKLNRKVAILADHDRQPLKSFLSDEKAQILMITNKKASSLCGLQEAEGCFSLIVNVDFHKDVQHYRKLHQFILKTGGTIVSFVAQRKEVQRIQRNIGLNFAEVSGIANTQDINKQIVGDIQFVSTPQTETYSILKMLPYSSEQVSARLFQILHRNMTQTKKSKYLDLIGYITYQIKTDVEFNSYKYVWNFLKDMPQQITQNIRNMTKFKNGKGAVFNVPSHYKYQMDHFIRKLSKHHKDNKFQLSIVYQMPQIQNVGSVEYKQIEQKKLFAMKNKRQLELYVGGLPFKAKEPQIRTFFLKYNVNPLTIRIMKDRDGISKGICFILCEDREHVARALKLDQTKFDEKYTIRVHIAQNKQRRWEN